MSFVNVNPPADDRGAVFDDDEHAAIKIAIVNADTMAARTLNRFAIHPLT